MEDILDRIEIYTDKIEIRPNEDDFYIRGNCYLHIGSFDEAVADFTEAIKLNNKPEYLYMRGMAFEGKEDFKAAKKDFEEVKKDKEFLKAILALDFDDELLPRSYQF